jgi:hypothetical protein
MLKSSIAALAVSATALLTFGLSTVTATPSFAATTTEPLVIGPQVTITVSCPRDHHAVDHSGKLSCERDKKHHRTAKPPTAKAASAPAPTPWSQSGAIGGWQHCWHHDGWPGDYWATAGDNSWL